MTITVSPTKSRESHAFSVKVMKQGKKSEYIIHKFSISHNFTTMQEMNKFLCNFLKHDIGNFGYIEPGHGLKGRQQWIVQDTDVQEMYRAYSKRREILLWCVQPSANVTKNSESRKRSSPASVPEADKGKRSCTQKIRDVEDIMKQLKEKHGQMYSTEQYSCWAHMFHMEKHRSLEVPPGLPFFSQSRGKKPIQSTLSPQPATIECLNEQQKPSPSKRVNLRSESIKQLVDWHSLLEKGGISKEQYEDMQEAILKDIKENLF